MAGVHCYINIVVLTHLCLSCIHHYSQKSGLPEAAGVDLKITSKRFLENICNIATKQCIEDTQKL